MACVDSGVPARVPGVDDTARKAGRVLRGTGPPLAARCLERSADWFTSFVETTLVFLKGPPPCSSSSCARLFGTRGTWFFMKNGLGCPSVAQVFRGR